MTFTAVSGEFWRAVDAGTRDAALEGSHRPGRYSRAGQPTLYLSASREGVEAAAAPWQDRVAAGLEPSSWSVRDRLEAHGAQGLIDPSRHRPDLWHLVLFRWNAPGAASVRRSGAGT